MNLVEVKQKIQETLIEYMQTKSKKEYMFYSVLDRGTAEHFSSIARDKGRHGGWVYIVTTLDQKQVKIGYTERNPVERVKEIFPGSNVYVAAFLCLYSKSYIIENYVKRILYSTGLQSRTKTLSGITAYSGGTEIFDIKPRIACALVDEAVTEYSII
jgi:hypothetical protein